MFIQNAPELYTGQISFTLLNLFGIWWSQTGNSQWKILLYHIYSTLMLTIFFSLIFSLFMHLLLVPEDVDSFTENLVYFLTAFAVLIKVINIVVQQRTVMEAQNMHLNKLCQPRDLYESKILQQCSEVCRSKMIIFLILINITAVLLILFPLVRRNKITLPLSGWYPYSLESRCVFCLTYLYQTVAILMAACSSASVEGLALVIMLQICAQLEIIIHRLHLLPELRKKDDTEFSVCQHESKLLAECVEHHIFMYSLGQKLNKLFGFVIFVQFFASMLCLCVVIYQLSRLSLRNPTYWIMLSSLITITTQIFLYCFYGEKLIEKSKAITENVYRINWITLTDKTRKDLIIIMVRATRPIKLTGSSAIIMSIETFVKIMKSSYSAYNLLSSTS